MAKSKKPGITNNESSNIQQFIASVSRKNYSQANKYLQAAIHGKLKQRVKQTASDIGF